MPTTRKNGGKPNQLPSYATVAMKFAKDVGSPQQRQRLEEPLTLARPLAQPQPLAHVEEDPQIKGSVTQNLPEPKTIRSKPDATTDVEEPMDVHIGPEEDALLEDRAPANPVPEPTTVGATSNNPPAEPATAGATASNSPTELSDVAKTLLAGRKRLRKLNSQRVRVCSHLDFCKHCKDADKIPKGLRVNVQCNALLADYTNVKDKFKQTKTTAEHDFRDSLHDHYEETKQQLERDIKEVEDAIQTTLQRATQAERDEHHRWMDSTKQAWEREETSLQEAKRKKLDNLTRTSGSGTSNGRRGRGNLTRRPPRNQGNQSRNQSRNLDKDSIVEAVLEVLGQRQSEGQHPPSRSDRETSSWRQHQATRRGRAPHRNRRRGFH